MVLENRASPHDDEELIRGLIAEKKYHRALESLLQLYEKSIIVFCTGMLGYQDDAVDVAQEIFLAAYVAFERFEQRSSLRTWLFGIARNKCRNALRDRTNRRLLSRQEISLASVIYANPPPIPGQVTQDELLNRALEALSQLNEEERVVVLLRYKQAMTHAEIADVLCTSKSTVERRWRQALQHLGRFLDEFR